MTLFVKMQNRHKNDSRNRYIFLAIKILVSVGAIFWIFSTVQWHILIEKLISVNWVILGLSLVIFSIWLIPCALRWRKITQICGYPITLEDSARSYLIGGFFNAFLPTGRGGDVVRGILTAKNYGFSLGGVMGTIFVERFIGFVIALCFVIFTSLIAVSKIVELKNALIPATILSIFLSALILIGINPRFKTLFTKLIQKIPIPRFRNATGDIIKVFDICWKNPQVIAIAAGLSLLNQLALILSGFVMGFSIPDFRAPWLSFPIVIPLIFIAGLLPSIGGYGIREASFVFFFGWFGVNNEAAIVYGILQLIFIWVFSLVGAFFFVADRSRT